MTRQTFAAYWLPTVGIGPHGEMSYVHVPLTDTLKYLRADGTYQVDVINLMAASFNPGPNFANQPLILDPVLLQAIDEGQVAQVQAAGIKVVLTITGKDSLGWGSLSSQQQEQFISYVTDYIVAPAGLNLDGIDIDDEYPTGGPQIVPVVQALKKALPGTKILSKALWADLDFISEIASLLDYGAIMAYGDNAGSLESLFASYAEAGLPADLIMIGVNAGPGGGSFTSIPTAVDLAVWQPAGGSKLGMMLWSFSQDIQQFTAYPQNQPDLAFPNGNDHSWQQAMIFAMESGPANGGGDLGEN